MKREKENKTQIETVPQGDQPATGVPQGGQSAKGAPQGTQAATGATESDQVEDKVDKPAGKKKKRIRYSFPTVSRCPRCGTTDTVAYRTAKNIQYRRCLRAICRWSYSVRGKKV